MQPLIHPELFCDASNTKARIYEVEISNRMPCPVCGRRLNLRGVASFFTDPAIPAHFDPRRCPASLICGPATRLK